MIGPSAATLARVLLATVVGVLPVFLLGSLSVLISGDVPLDEQRLGAAAAAFWTASALFSWVAGHLGLYHLAIVRLRPHAPAAASGAAATALFLGSIVGPLGFGPSRRRGRSRCVADRRRVAAPRRPRRSARPPVARPRRPRVGGRAQTLLLPGVRSGATTIRRRSGLPSCPA